MEDKKKSDRELAREFTMGYKLMQVMPHKVAEIIGQDDTNNLTSFREGARAAFEDHKDGKINIWLTEYLSSKVHDILHVEEFLELHKDPNRVENVKSNLNIEDSRQEGYNNSQDKDNQLGF